jgi:hypothetical protein
MCKNRHPTYLSEIKGLNGTPDGVGGWIDILWGAEELIERSGGIGAGIDF